MTSRGPESKLSSLFQGSSVLITGGTGSFGQALVSRLLEETSDGKIIVYSRDEMKQWAMRERFGDPDRLRFFIGDVRDRDRLHRAFQGVDYVVHAAATKIVPVAEYNPFETVKTNVIGAMNVIDAALDNNVKKVVALSTDKASSPVNLYGATKLASDKLFVAGNSYSGAKPTRFSVVRYGNVMGSRGSVIPYFLSLAPGTPSPITDYSMTRFMITLNQGIDLVLATFDQMTGGEVFVRKIPSMRVVDIAKAIRPTEEVTEVGIRPGEKMHEQMISSEDAPLTIDCGDYYKILPAINTWVSQDEMWSGGARVDLGFRYVSDVNDDWMTQEDLAKWVRENKDSFIGI